MRRHPKARPRELSSKSFGNGEQGQTVFSETDADRNNRRAPTK